MIADGTPTPLTPELTDAEIAARDRIRAREAEELEQMKSALAPIAQALGINIRVVHNPLDWRWDITAALPTRAPCSIDEEMLLNATPGYTPSPQNRAACVDLILREMECLQLSLFDAARAHMDKHDARQRIAKLSKADENTLHEMFMEAEKALYAPFTYGNEPGFQKQEAKRREFGELLRRLTR